MNTDLRAEVLATCHALFEPGQVVEMRIFDLPGRSGFRYNAAGWFNSPERLAEVAEVYSAKDPSGIYVTINRMDRACLARSDNAIIERIRHTTSDRDMTHRLWLPIDIDTRRPAGISATTEELRKTCDCAVQIRKWLQEEYGFPQPLLASSGNGIWMFYRILLPNDEDSKALTQSVLRAISAKFENDHAIIDQTSFNAARIVRLFGTINRKGSHTSERPHRQTKMLDRVGFEHVTVVDINALRRLGAGGIGNGVQPPASPASSPTGVRPPQRRVSATNPNAGEHFFDLDAWIRNNAIDVVRSEPFDGTGVRHILRCCLFDASHTGTSAIIGRGARGTIFYKCQHASCANRTWKDARDLFRQEGGRPPLLPPQPADGAASIVVRKSPGKKKDSKKKGDGLSSDSDPWEIASQFIRHEYTDDLGRVKIRRHRGTFYVYSERKRCYAETSNDTLRVEITRFLGENGLPSQCRKVSDAFNSVASMVTVSEEVDMPCRTTIDMNSGCAISDPKRYNWLTLKNGIIDLDRVLAGEQIDSCLMNHTTDWLNTISLTFDFPTTAEEATCPKMLEFLGQCFDEDPEMICLIQEMFGYCYWTDNSLEKFFILFGKGNNGKSTILEILQDLLGPQNVSNLSLDQIAEPTMRGDLNQKLANICGDLQETETIEEGLIKRITSGEVITVRRLYYGPMSFRPFCKLIFGTNPLPRFSDISLGVWRRMILIPFERIVPESEIDTRLKMKLRKELPGIFVWALQGAARLAAKQSFSPCKAAAEANIEYRMSCFPVLTFIEECTKQGGEINSFELWNVYRAWCRKFGLTKVMPLHSFIKNIITLTRYVSVPKTRTDMISRIQLRGIRLKEGLILTDSDSAP